MKKTEVRLEELEAIARALAVERDVARAFLTDGPKGSPMIVIAYDERPASVEAASTRIQELVALLAGVLGDRAHGVGFSAGGPEDVALYERHGRVFYERGATS